MKAELMALALLFALIGYVNSYVGPAAADRSMESIPFLNEAGILPGIDSSWQPNGQIQAFLYILQAALGGAMVLYFIRHRRRERSSREWDYDCGAEY